MATAFPTAAASIWRASHESRHYSFEAFGRTADEATAALYRTLEVHRRQTGASLEWVVEAMEDAAEPRQLALGVGYRDGEVCDVPEAEATL